MKLRHGVPAGGRAVAQGAAPHPDHHRPVARQLVGQDGREEAAQAGREEAAQADRKLAHNPMVPTFVGAIARFAVVV